MTEPGGILDAQTQAMIAQLRRYEVEQVTAILDRAHASATAVRGEAYAQARLTVRNAVQRERRRRAATALKTRARAETRARLDNQLHVGRLLALGWERMPAILAARWQDADARRRWWRGAIAGARQRLLGQRFIIEHPSGLLPEELDDMRAACGDQEVSFQAVDALTAGVRISADGGCLDASAASLLADRDRLESLLLGAYQDLGGEAGGSDA